MISARFRGPKKRHTLHNGSGKGDDPNTTVEAGEKEGAEVKQSGGKGKTGKPFAGERESATTATKKDSPPETPEEEETLAAVDEETKSAVKEVTKLARENRAKQRREGEVYDRNDDDFDAGRLSGGVADGAIAAASVMAEHLVTDVQEGLSELDVDTDDDAECVPVGPCLRCEQLELDAEYCKETGRRQEVSREKYFRKMYA